MAKRIAFVDKNRCVACGVCINACTKSAITVHRGCYAKVDDTKCVGCGICAKACPVGCIEVKERETGE